MRGMSAVVDTLFGVGLGRPPALVRLATVAKRAGVEPDVVLFEAEQRGIDLRLVRLGPGGYRHVAVEPALQLIQAFECGEQQT